MKRSTSLFFDAKDYEILHVVNTFIKDRIESSEVDGEKKRFFHSALHPHGIKELAVSQEIRVAYAVIDLLGSLEAGQLQDRINALQTLHDEVLYSESSSFRHNTGRVLIEIMKGLIRAYGQQELQLKLAHDFRAAVSGKRRIVRQMLKRYHLLEMPEAWNQVAFDNHVHDANTKGRKSATHLIMDAWIKGIRELNIVYYNYVEPKAVEELLQAAAIMDIKVTIGVEFQAQFRGKHVQFVWEPLGFHDYRDFLDFLEEKPTRHLMQFGREASTFHHHYVLDLLERYNAELRHVISREFRIELPVITEAEILSLVGNGQTSRTHLAELIYRQMRTAFSANIEQFREEYATGSEERRQAVAQMVERMNRMTPDVITDEWLSPLKNPDIPLPRYSRDVTSVPEIMRLLPDTLMDWLTSVHSPCNVVLNINSLTIEDVLELLYTCEGLISHIELFNLKNYAAGKMANLPSISNLQSAINEGSAIALKRMIRTIIKGYNLCGADDADERCRLFSEILRNIPKLQAYYSETPLKTRIGSDSTGRASRLHGMGFIFPETLPYRSRKAFAERSGPSQIIPLQQSLYRRITLYPRAHPAIGPTLTGLIRKIPGCKYFAMRKERDWVKNIKSAHYVEKGNIGTLGGYQYDHRQDFTLEPPKAQKEDLPLWYMNTTAKNVLKVLFGYVLTVATFLYTQDWWFLAWFGPLIWFGITGFRNVVQATLGGGGIRRTPLLRWNDYLSWSRLCDSLLYTGLSVPILELGVRWLFLEQTLGLNPVDDSLIFYSAISLVNGIYIAAHNIYRGFPQEAVIGNIFRSFVAIPVSVFYSFAAMQLFDLAGWDTFVVIQGAAVISKLASDSVAAVIEGFADKMEFLRMRHWDYSAKLKLLFSSVSQLEVLLPDEDIIECFKTRSGLCQYEDDSYAQQLERVTTICALDLMYFWMYLPRARSTLGRLLPQMTPDERLIFAGSQSLLLNVQKISQLFVDGLVGINFAKPLAFYLAKHEEYLRDMESIIGIPIRPEVGE